MSISVILDVAIGLALTYMLLGLVASGVQETVATALSWRGKQLRDGIDNLLAGNGPIAGAAAMLANDVHGHPLVQGTSSSGLPSYVSARSFSGALFDVLTQGLQAPVFSQIESSVAALPPCPARQSLSALLTQAGGDLDKLQASVETWYEDAMDRLSGDYKRFSHYFTLLLGLVVAVAFNVDSIHLAKSLWDDPTQRAAYVALATRYADQTLTPQKTDPQKRADAMQVQAKQAAAALAALPGPIGWDVPEDRTFFGVLIDKVFARNWTGIWVVLGWIVTAFAVSLGAPFWFDTLQKLFNLRGSGPKPDPAPSANSATP